MSTGAKVAIGCAVAFVGAAILASAVLFGGLWWLGGKARQKVREVSADSERLESLRKQANANPFTPPADGVIREERLVKFLAARKRVFAVYEKHRGEIETLSQHQPRGLEGLKVLGSLPGLVTEVLLAQAEALADEGMSEEEYRYLVTSVYKTWGASEVEKATGGSVSEAAGDAAERAATEAEKAAEQPNLPDEARQALRESAHKMREQADSAREQTKQLDVPPANIALFRKYESEIRKYAMGGLEAIGL